MVGTYHATTKEGLIMKRLIASSLLAFGIATVGILPAHSAPLAVLGATASSEQAPNVAGNTLDGNLATRWSAQGDGETITFELETCDTVSGISIAWHDGDKRIAFFDVETSEDGTTFIPAITGGESNGISLTLQPADFEDRHACFVRIVGHGNSALRELTALWNSITEVQILGVNDAPADTVPIPLSLLEELCSQLPIAQ